MSDSSHDVLGPLAAFAGNWRGSGAGHYATIDSFVYDEEIELSPSGKPFLFYRQKTFAPNGGRPMHTETGYLRLAGSNHIELVIAQPTGFAELQRAAAHPTVLEFVQHTLGVSPDAKQVLSVRRRFELTSPDTLVYDLWMAYADVPISHHLRAELTRAD
ncbi:MAG: FABP family protein [Gordonia sp. (in: high G+C Gram-positive bacteria)]|uniref:FABP family protein n=1 Tax=Gordonia sp. (in: high G+C Gram-positive bacteria) TaxID=84139 RepID=UPI003C713E18